MHARENQMDIEEWTTQRHGQHWAQDRTRIWLFIFKRGDLSLFTFHYSTGNSVMKRKFEQWYSTIPPLSMKRTIITHLNICTNVAELNLSIHPQDICKEWP